MAIEGWLLYMLGYLGTSKRRISGRGSSVKVEVKAPRGAQAMRAAAGGLGRVDVGVWTTEGLEQVRRSLGARHVRQVRHALVPRQRLGSQDAEGGRGWWRLAAAQTPPAPALQRLSLPAWPTSGTNCPRRGWQASRVRALRQPRWPGCWEASQLSCYTLVLAC